MKTGELIKRFETHTRAPIKINDVKNHIIQSRTQDEINFIGVEYDVSIIRGNLVQYSRHGAPYAEPIFVSNVYYDRNQPEDWKRLVCCKEMLHIIDHTLWKTKTREQVSELISRIALPPDLRKIIEEMQDRGESMIPDQDHKMRAIIDSYTDLKAVAVLFPMAIRELLMPKYVPDGLTSDEIARLTKIPVRYISFVMSKEWPDLYEALTKT